MHLPLREPRHPRWFASQVRMLMLLRSISRQPPIGKCFYSAPSGISGAAFRSLASSQDTRHCVTRSSIFKYLHLHRTDKSPSLGGCDHPPNLKYLNQVHRLSATPNHHEKQLRLQKRRLLRYVRCNRASHRMRICWMVAFPSIAP